MFVSNSTSVDIVQRVCVGVSTLQIADNEDKEMIALSQSRAPLSVKTNQAIMQLAGNGLGCVRSQGRAELQVAYCALGIKSLTSTVYTFHQSSPIIPVLNLFGEHGGRCNAVHHDCALFHVSPDPEYL